MLTVPRSCALLFALLALLSACSSETANPQIALPDSRLQSADSLADAPDVQDVQVQEDAPDVSADLPPEAASDVLPDDVPTDLPLEDLPPEDLPVQDVPPAEVVPEVVTPCVTDADCPDGEVCVEGACLPGPECESSKDCAVGVCWVEAGLCVECLGAEDCPEGAVCQDHLCIVITSCDSDKDCTPLDMVCDFASGTCVNCVAHTDCAPEQYCADHLCVPDVCLPGAALCQDNAIVTCTEIGDSYGDTVACGATQTCVEAEDEVACVDWLCQPGPPYCDPANGHAVTCSDDGLEVLDDVDCGASDLTCVNGECLAVICPAGQTACSEDQWSLLTCSPDGLQWTEAPCPAATYCKPADDAGEALCAPQACAPAAPLCVGEVATACDDLGSGPLPGGVDCAVKGETCLDGACVACGYVEYCDGVDNNCNGQVDEYVTDCFAPSACLLGNCYQPPNYNCWVKTHGGHVYLACYINGTSFPEAEAICTGWYGSHMLVLNNQAEEAFILNNISGVAMLGYSDQQQEADWVWAAGTSTYENWCLGEPNNAGQGEDCATMKNNLGGQYNCWNDVMCGTQISRFICEVDNP